MELHSWQKILWPSLLLWECPTMSDYEDYTTTSKHYDTGRQAVDIEGFIGAICVSTKGRISKARVVDVGCGTGNYIAAISPYVGTVTGVEYNPDMLVKAKAKTKDLPNVQLMSGDATNLPLDSDSYDALMCTQVIHHFPGEGLVALSKFISEAHRVLSSNGAIIINTDTPEQCRRCWIGAGLVPCHTAVNRYPTIEELTTILTKTGFRIGSINAICYPQLFQSQVVSNPDGPLNKEWRNMDSFWSLLSEEELKEVQEKWKTRQSNGTTREFFKGREDLIKQIGETTTVIAYKQ